MLGTAEWHHLFSGYTPGVWQEWQGIPSLPFPSSFSSILHLPSLVLAACSWQSQELRHSLCALWLDSWTCSGVRRLQNAAGPNSCLLQSHSMAVLLPKHKERLINIAPATMIFKNHTFCLVLGNLWALGWDTYTHIHIVCMHVISSAYLCIYGSVSIYMYVYMHRFSLICRTG